MRIRNPEVIYATWASSAPVHAQVDMAAYYKAAERSLTRNCSSDWVAVTRYVDGVLNDTDEARQIDIKFDLEFARLSGKGGNTTLAKNLTRGDAARLSNVQAAGILMDPLRFYQVGVATFQTSVISDENSQYYGFSASILPFCNLLETQNFTADPLESGIAASRDVETAFKAFTVALAELDYDQIRGSPDDPVTDMSWMWQYCSEYGIYLDLLPRIFPQVSVTTLQGFISEETRIILFPSRPHFALLTFSRSNVTVLFRKDYRPRQQLTMLINMEAGI